MTRAIVLAAGQGSRLRPLTDDRPKCMVPYRGVPLIDRVIASLRGGGVDDIVVVKGYRAEALERADVRSYVYDGWEKTNMVSTLFSVEHELVGPVIVSYSDIAYRTSVVERLRASTADVAVVVDRAWRDLWAKRMADPLADAETLKLDDAGRILELGKKPRSYSEIQGQYIGLFQLSPRGAEAIRAIYHGLDRAGSYDGQPFPKMFMTSLLQRAIDAGLDVRAVPIDGGWIEIDTPADLTIMVDV